MKWDILEFDGLKTRILDQRFKASNYQGQEYQKYLTSKVLSSIIDRESSTILKKTVKKDKDNE